MLPAARYSHNYNIGSVFRSDIAPGVLPSARYSRNNDIRVYILIYIYIVFLRSDIAPGVLSAARYPPNNNNNIYNN